MMLNQGHHLRIRSSNAFASLPPDAVCGRSKLAVDAGRRERLPGDGSLLDPVAVWQMILPTFKRYLHSFEAGSAQQYLNLSAIKKMRLIVPSKKAQNAFVELRDTVPNGASVWRFSPSSAKRVSHSPSNRPSGTSTKGCMT
jgi:hypothetical protein